LLKSNTRDRPYGLLLIFTAAEKEKPPPSSRLIPAGPRSPRLTHRVSLKGPARATRAGSSVVVVVLVLVVAVAVIVEDVEVNVGVVEVVLVRVMGVAGRNTFWSTQLDLRSTEAGRPSAEAAASLRQRKMSPAPSQPASDTPQQPSSSARHRACAAALSGKVSGPLPAARAGP